MRYTLGQVNAPTPAGEIGGIALLVADLQATAATANQFLRPGFRFNRSVFEGLMARFKPRAGESNAAAAERLGAVQQSLSGDEIQQLIAGTIGQIAVAVVQAKMTAQLPVITAQERNSNITLQASLIDPARLMWSSLNGMLRNMQARAAQPGASGLGEPISITIVVVLIVAGALLYAAAIVAATYLVDAYYRTQHASSEVARICHEAGGCTPEQQVRLQRELALGPFDSAIPRIGEGIGKGFEIAIATVGIGGAALGVGAFWYYVLGGREWVARKTGS